MDPDRLRNLARPTNAQEAEAWLAAVVNALGPRFDPDQGFRDYWLDDEQVDRLNAVLVRVCGLLHGRARDLTYREAANWLRNLDLSFRAWARPVSQPPPRLWLVERPGTEDEADDILDPTVGLAFEDADGIWSIWEPATGRFHYDTPWLFTDYYYHARAHRGVFVKNDFEQLIRFTPKSRAEAQDLIATGTVSGAGAEYAAIRQDDDNPGPYLADVVAQASDPSGWQPTGDRGVVIDSARKPESQGPLPPMTGMVQLFDVEVDGHRLTAEEPGRSLAEALQPFEPFEDEPDLDSLPLTGWRQVGEWPTSGSHGPRILFVAPHPEDPDGWAMLDVDTVDGYRSCSTHSGPVRQRASKEARRAALVLGWPREPILAIAGEKIELTARVTNLSDSEWRDRDPGHSTGQIPDDLLVVAWLYEKNGTRLPAASGFSRASLNEGQSIAAGQTVAVPVILLTEDTEHIPPGEYEIRAVLSRLDLHAKPAILKLVNDDNRPPAAPA